MNILSCCSSNTPHAHFFSSVYDISDEIWKELQCVDNLYFNKKYLGALEKHNPQIQFSYIVLLHDNQNPIAFATIQVVDFYLDSVQNDMQSLVEWIKCMGRKVKLISPEKPFKILTCGNTFVSGEHGIYINQNQDKKQVVNQLAKAVIHHANKNFNNSIDAYMLKDFIKESLFITDELLEDGYNSFNVEPNMVLNIDKDWLSFDDYLAALKTKFRVKAKRAIKLSSPLKVENISNDRVKDLLPEMTSLYKTVSSKSSFNLGDFNLQTYSSLKETLNNNFFLKAYWLEDKLVGFLSGVINKNSLDAHFVGIDYKYNRDYAVYQRMLYDYIRLSIEYKVEVLNFGRTASEIKSSVGAIPEELTIYLRHKKTIPNRILSLFLKRIQPSEFSQKHPFKKKLITEKVS